MDTFHNMSEKSDPSLMADYDPGSRKINPEALEGEYAVPTAEIPSSIDFLERRVSQLLEQIDQMTKALEPVLIQERSETGSDEKVGYSPESEIAKRIYSKAVMVDIAVDRLVGLKDRLAI